MYLFLFRQGQAGGQRRAWRDQRAVRRQPVPVGLSEYLCHTGASAGHHCDGRGPDPADGLRLEDVSFTYPGAEQPALSEVSLHLRPGRSLALVGSNGSGKTTLIKLITRLYMPTSGRIVLDGRELEEWDVGTLRQRFGVIFQDYVRYQMLVGENIGAGDEAHFEEEPRWREAAGLGQADEMIGALPSGYHTQLGKWFLGGRELSGGQWQKIAVSRSFMRRDCRYPRVR